MDSLDRVETLEWAMDSLERLHLKLQLEAGGLPPNSEIARILIDLSEEMDGVTQKIRRVLGKRDLAMSSSS